MSHASLLNLIPYRVRGGRPPVWLLGRALEGGDAGESPELLLAFDVGDYPTTDGAADFNGDSYYSATSNSGLQVGDADAWFAGWFLLDSKSATQALIAKHDASTAEGSEFDLIFDEGSDRLKFTVYNGGAGTSVPADTFGSVPTGQRIFVFIYHDAVNDEIGIRVNNGAFDTEPHSGGLNTTGQPLQLGGILGGFLLDGRMGAVAFGKSPPGGGIAALADTIADVLYNGGDGVGYPSLSSEQKTAWGLVSWYAFDGPLSVLGEDSHGTNHLTAVGSTPSVVMPGLVRGTRRAWNGERVYSVSGGIAEGDGATRGSYPEVLVPDDNGPGYVWADTNVFLRPTFHAFVRWNDPIINGAAIGAGTYLPDGSYGVLNRDANGLLSLDTAGASGSDPQSQAADIPLYGRWVIASGSSVEGVGKFDADPLKNQDPRAIWTVVLEEPDDPDNEPDPDIGYHFTIANTNAAIDGTTCVVRSYHPPSRTMTFAAADNTSADLTATPGGTLTPTGGYEETAQWWPSPKSQVYPAYIEVKKAIGGVVTFRQGNYNLGGGTNAALHSSTTTSGATTTVGARLADLPADLPAELPSRLEAWSGALDEAGTLAAMSKLSWRIAARDWFGGHAAFVEQEAQPTTLRIEGHLLDRQHLWKDNASGLIISGPTTNGDRSGLGRGQFSAQVVGSDRQTSTTTHTATISAFSRAWDWAGAREVRTPITVVDLPITRRPYLRERFVDLATGDNDTGTGGQFDPWRTVAFAIEHSPPGTAIRVAGSATMRIQVGDAPEGIAVTPWDDEEPIELALGDEAIDANGAARGVLVRGVAISHTGETNVAIRLDGAASAGLTISDISSSLGGSATGAAVINLAEASSFLALHDITAAPSEDAVGTGYPILGGVANRRVSIRRVTTERPCGSGEHVLRMVSNEFLEIAGFVHDPLQAETGNKAFTLRSGLRRAMIRSISIPGNPFGLDPDNGAENAAPSRPVPSGIVLEDITAADFNIHGIGAIRYSNLVALDGNIKLDDQVYYPDLQVAGTDGGTIENCAALNGGIFDLDSPSVRAYVESGNRKSVTSATLDRADSLAAATLIDHTASAPAGNFLVAIDDLPVGGSGRVVMTWVIDEVHMPELGHAGQHLLYPTTAGEHTVAVRVTDADSAVVTGTPITVTVA